MIVGVSGYGFTGSAAFIDLLKEYSEFNYVKVNKCFEFTIPYEPDGLLDLEYCLVKSPAKHLKGDVAISRFNNLAHWLSRSMNRVTNGEFSNITESYIESITQVKYYHHRVVDVRNSHFGIFAEKALGIIQGKIEKKIKKYVPIKKENTCYISVYPDNFLEKTRKYIDDIIQAAGLKDSSHIVLLDQPFPPNNPEDVFHFYEDPYAIVVNRDPRDIYVIVKHLRFSSARFIPHDTVEDFVEYYRNVVKHRPDKDPSRVFRIQFEDLIYEYETTVAKIEDFLKITQHKLNKEFFDPDESIKNTNMRNLFPEDSEAMEYIERELQDYLYPFEKYGISPNRDGILELAAR